ncbi:protein DETOXIFICATION 19-like [Amaranthus tricolor]|uniref:protein DETOXIFICATION 19-like n=1 Tax=Amaranthus tricolor TaxID=29722 RepID=UPI002584C65C|nr:protein DETOXIFICATION 19-like [Amaranthus tricolor]
MDAKEAKKQILFAVPIILTNIFYNLIPTVSIMFTGHLGELELASSTLAQSWATVTGYSFMIGLSGALETLCGQGFGAKMYNMLGIYLQASCIVSFIFSIAISLLWWYTEPILILLHQNPNIAKQSAIYMRFLIPGIFAYGILQNILRFFQTQSVVLPIVLFSLLPLLLHIAFTNLLVHHTSLGFQGAALATSLTFWFSVLILVVYVCFAKTFKRTWTGLSFTTFSYVFTNFNLALYSASMLCLEYWAFEILVILAGIMPNSEETTSLIAMCVYTEAIAFMVTYGMSAAARY